MSSIQALFKQIPTEGQYFISLTGATGLNLNKFVEDPLASTTSYVSGALNGTFVTSNTGPLVATGAGGTTTIFRDMGITLVSSSRTFRAVQLLNTDPSAGTGWTSTTPGVAGVWKASTEGVGGAPLNSNTLADFNVLYFETGARGLGIAQGLIRYG
jgi:hypothetical protein